MSDGPKFLNTTHTTLLLRNDSPYKPSNLQSAHVEFASDENIWLDLAIYKFPRDRAFYIQYEGM